MLDSVNLLSVVLHTHTRHCHQTVILLNYSTTFNLICSFRYYISVTTPTMVCHLVVVVGLMHR